jgi:hypothetical protein
MSQAIADEQVELLVEANDGIIERAPSRCQGD